MIAEFGTVVLLIAVFSCVQSIFGMGILVFGTPSLLLLGYGFAETLSFLLPSSIAISIFQVIRPGIPRPKIPRHLYIYCLPAIVVFLWLSVSSGLAEYAGLLVGVILILSAATRILPRIRTAMAQIIESNMAIYHFAMGVVHGVSNLGGAMLAVFAANLYRQKEQIRYTVAHYYLAFGVLQCTVLLATGSSEILLDGILMSPVAAVVYVVIGSPLFKKLRDTDFENAMSGFILAYGVVLLSKSFV